MVQISGIGGFFFRAKDPKVLSDWYEKHFGILKVPQSYDEEPWRQEAGVTVFAPFPTDGPMFGADDKTWMLNFRVVDLDEAVAELEAHGIGVNLDPEIYPNGRFASLKDPEGNPIQLWQESN